MTLLMVITCHDYKFINARDHLVTIRNLYTLVITIHGYTPRYYNIYSLVITTAYVLIILSHDNKLIVMYARD